jgi:hypothetical protein
VSQKVLREAPCSVRVARGISKSADEPVRLVVGVDASKGAEAAVKAIATRHWPKRSEVRVAAALGAFPPTTIPPIAPKHIPAELLEQILTANQRRLSEGCKEGG